MSNMKLAVLSDIHANHTALEAVLEQIYAGDYDRLVFLGDYVTDCPNPRKTLELLHSVPARYDPVFIRGNREDYLIAHRRNPSGWERGSKTGALLYTFENLRGEDFDWFETLPISARLGLCGCPPLIACHGSPTKSNYLFHTETPEAEALLASLDCDTLLCGHSHAPYIFRRGARQIINAGALGLPKNGQTAAQFMQVECDGGEWRAELVSVEYDIESEVAEFLSSGLLEQSGIWGRALVGTLRFGVNYSVHCLREVERLSAESGLPVTDEALWRQAAENIGLPEI